MKVKRANRDYVAGLLVFALAGGIWSDVQAVCYQSQLAGTWHAIGTTGNARGDGFEEYIKCKIVLSSTGAVVASSSSCIGRDDVGRFTVNITGGSLVLSSACAVTGRITFYAGVAIGHTIEFGQMSLDKSIFTFASYQTYSPYNLALFTAIKQ